MRAYLEYKMKSNRITKEDIQNLLNVSEKTVRNKLTGISDFTWPEAQLIKHTYFPEEDYDKLFENIKDTG